MCMAWLAFSFQRELWEWVSQSSQHQNCRKSRELCSPASFSRASKNNVLPPTFRSRLLSSTFHLRSPLRIPVQSTPRRILTQATMSFNLPICMHLRNVHGTLLQLMLLESPCDIWEPVPLTQPLSHRMVTRNLSIYGARIDLARP